MHVDPDTLALLALGERVADHSDRIHLASCAACAGDLRQFSEAVAVGRSTLDAGEFVEPAPRVWDRIAEELSLQSAAHPSARGDDLGGGATVTDLSRRRRRPWVAVGAVAASAALAATATIGVWQVTRQDDSTVVASAALDAFPSWPGASGDAVVEQEQDGSRVVQISYDASGLDDDYVEAWLLSSDATRLVSLGTMDGASGTFAIPAGVDLSVYDQVDISAEPYDGDPAHSGDSIVRGQLTDAT